MIIKYRIIKEENLLIQRYTGRFNIDYYSNYINILLQDPNWKFVKKALSDFIDLDLSSVMNNYDEIIRIKKEVINKKYFNVFVVEKPNTTASMHLYKDALVDFDIEFCSSIEYAILLLELKISEKEINQIIEDL